ncbi:MAG: 1-deoxy-D-xylulose-5-phosphate reductoisomerase [Firmicutes bacterium]|nr:1-deoxy-D-xylulose-5-phosphate reductoisomerase [Bacillota bacterium]
MKKQVIILGSTGSIGRQALEVIANHPEEFTVYGLTANRNSQILIEQAKKFKPKYVVIAQDEEYLKVKAGLAGTGVEVLAGFQSVIDLAGQPVDRLLVSLVGAAGIKPTIAGIEAGSPIALANKESLVAAGSVVMELSRKKGVPILPVDSEHSAIFQCLQASPKALKSIWLTASGGPFRTTPKEELGKVRPEDALKHPNWDMGAKITIDSATLVNKGLEVIEAHLLFQVPYDHIKVLVHPGSIVHSLVEFTDGSVLAQLGWPDMRLPIQYALTYPERLQTHLEPLDLLEVGRLEFEAPDTERFPGLKLAFEAGKAGGTMPAVYNAANEVAVQHFLRNELPFTGIPSVIADVMSRHSVVSNPDLEEILRYDAWARAEAERTVAAR